MSNWVNECSIMTALGAWKRDRVVRLYSSPESKICALWLWHQMQSQPQNLAARHRSKHQWMFADWPHRSLRLGCTMHCLSTQSGHQLNPAVLFFQEIPLPAQIFSWKRKDKGTDEVSRSPASVNNLVSLCPVPWHIETSVRDFWFQTPVLAPAMCPCRSSLPNLP